MLRRAHRELKHHPLPHPFHPETHSGIPKINQLWREASNLLVLSMKLLKGYGRGNIKWNNNLQKIISVKTHFCSIDKTFFFFFLQFQTLSRNLTKTKKYVHRYAFCSPTLSRVHLEVIRMPPVKIKSLIPCHPPPQKVSQPWIPKRNIHLI